MDGNKIKILVVQTDHVGGVGFYRSFQPHQYITANYGNEFEVAYNSDPDWADNAYFEQFDIIHVHKGIFPKIQDFYKQIIHLKDTNTVTVLDLDDSWELSEAHPNYLIQKQYKLDELVVTGIKLFDYITTTTSKFAKEIYKINKHVFVIPNGIDPNDDRFKLDKPVSDKLRVGFIMGSHHEADIKLLDRFILQIPEETRKKIQIVLCGFDLNGVARIIDPNTGQVQQRPIKPKETVWYRYEVMLTDNYKILSDKYKRFLEMFVKNLDYPEADEEGYKRCWTKDINHYYSHYNNIDVLLAPLAINKFNHVKSELKVAECCFSDTALIASDYGPYNLVLKNAWDKNGQFNPEGNSILINEEKNATDWAKAITMLAEDRNKLDILKKNIHDDFCDKLSLETITKKRIGFYKEILNYTSK